jgi:hypothetical protein
MIRYYPQSRIKVNQSTKGNEFLLNGQPYVGLYYETFDGKVYSGANPIIGKNERLEKIRSDFFISDSGRLPKTLDSELKKSTGFKVQRSVEAPVPYYPFPTEEDYKRGYIERCFLKRENDRGYVMEISPDEYSSIANGSANYDISRYQIRKIMWKLTGPLNKVRYSQYDIRAGIIDTNERLVLEAEKTFIGLKDFIGGEYDKFSKPTK